MAAALDLRSKEEKDAELDRRIAALRRKNEAIIRRYQEIEEDRKKAEQEGVAVTTLRRTRDPPIAPQEQRPGKEKKAPGGPQLGRGSRPRPPPRGDPPGDPHLEGAGDWKQRGRGRGKVGVRGGPGPSQASKWEQRRRQNIERMNEEMEKIAEYERSQRDGLPEKNPVRNFLDDPRRSGPSQDSDRRDGSRRHGRNWGGPDFDKVKTGMERERERTWPSPGRHGGAGDMTLSMTGRERAEYLRWKQERERIDQERLARHRKPGGQWRREWDAEKSESMFLEGSTAAPSWDPASRDEHQRPAPKPPTLAEFLPQQKPRGRGAKSYSMHDNRWEEKEPAEMPENWETEEAPTRPPLDPPHSLIQEEEEEEEQWEDVSEEDEDEDEDEDASEEEEDEEDGGSAEPLSKEEPPSRLSPLEPPQRDEARPSAEQEAEDGMRGSLDAAPGSVEISGFQRVRFHRH
ncbi:coiled-coil domain-containing protein 9 isoform X2 [Melopsittacus undulatus]|uniref:coiled-coil domain-containing protein 9 isoform X2 n=1 Tax=Melopsittacus undulatus TaxID=13146 RepID=UPI00146C1468|nr:coiled-coil domain-containing protein 9 isoform X2 [Melopsittacus undulatus]